MILKIKREVLRYAIDMSGGTKRSVSVRAIERTLCTQRKHMHGQIGFPAAVKEGKPWFDEQTLSDIVCIPLTYPACTKQATHRDFRRGDVQDEAVPLLLSQRLPRDLALAGQLFLSCNNLTHFCLYMNICTRRLRVRLLV